MTSSDEPLFRLFPKPHSVLGSHRQGAVGIPGLIRDEPTWTRHAQIRANRHVVANARSYTRMYLTLANTCVDIEDAARIGGVLMANAVAHSRVPEYAQISMQWMLLPTGELVIQVQDFRRDFPDFSDVVTWKPVEGEKPRGLWIARELGAELAFAPTEAGKIVQALIKPLNATGFNFPVVRQTP
ncbi:hypothetical protein [Streptomyces rhizosphaerihabitans]|uniref:hypothetical protein n=1 Tax=Streptomyces rhizosphaerihabitans TaxID=1266770 RepID=UPI0021BEE83E|nr:hypothetical protein [Streptomyces rhizosphaerihabitans]MCT9003552.1 hypothetical protein [Streptomyces rhizosphaerihabitans]